MPALQAPRRKLKVHRRRAGAVVGCAMQTIVTAAVDWSISLIVDAVGGETSCTAVASPGFDAPQSNQQPSLFLPAEALSSQGARSLLAWVVRINESLLCHEIGPIDVISDSQIDAGVTRRVARSVQSVVVAKADIALHRTQGYVGSGFCTSSLLQGDGAVGPDNRCARNVVRGPVRNIGLRLCYPREVVAR